ncbi:hypothetical protein B1987_13740 [Mycobacterium kansasii]|uniref:HTH cro/C1-type domain-containing protein n=1 Tax=Mycobacterium attenuatum TaxID=2341086 RepID=A0A498QGI9_9MYCO|nr:helix-turn-helix transcriptional regulator [Mycobacterium attenuatum]ORB84679.1 hypothetical protein B1987_13740 [Mycobacterium kansasii]VBA43963.1 hypothetical protein LAUMK136_05369 [Mycobacterium attenuatum]
MIFLLYAVGMPSRKTEDKWEPIDSLGTTGATVAKNIRGIRRKKGLAFTELATRLEGLGREIPTWGLRKIESGGRRVDADDLVALALALGVSPISLLMPMSESAQEPVEVTGVQGEVEARRVWRWLQAAAQLTDAKYDEFLTFVARALPPWRQREVTLVESGLEPHLTRFVRDPEGQDGHN